MRLYEEVVQSLKKILPNNFGSYYIIRCYPKRQRVIITFWRHSRFGYGSKPIAKIVWDLSNIDFTARIICLDAEDIPDSYMVIWNLCHWDLDDGCGEITKAAKASGDAFSQLWLKKITQITVTNLMKEAERLNYLVDSAKTLELKEKAIALYKSQFEEIS